MDRRSKLTYAHHTLAHYNRCMAALTTTSVETPLDVYLRSSYSPDCEWIDGELRGRNLGQFDHANLQGELYASLRSRVDRNYRVLLEQRLKVSPTRYRVPDLLVIERAYREQVVAIAPALIVEVLSPDDAVSEYAERIDDYLALGAGAIWIFDPMRRKAWSVSSTATWVPAVDVLRSNVVEVSVEEVFARSAD